MESRSSIGRLHKKVVKRRLRFALLTVDIKKANHFGADAFFHIKYREVGIFDNLVQTSAGPAFLRIHAARGPVVTT